VGVEAYVDDMLHGWCDPRLPTRAQQSAGTDPPSLKKRHRHDAPLPAFAQRLYSPLSSLDYIGQVDRKFLAARSGGDIVLVDQHAADERIRVERYLDIILAPGPVPTDELAVSLVLDVDEARSLAETMDALAAWGVEVEVVDIDGVGEAVRARARTVPRLVAERCRAESGLVAALVRQHLEDVRERGRRLRPDRKDVASCPRVLLELLNSKACRGALWVRSPDVGIIADAQPAGAIMFNDIVDDETAETLLRQLSTTRQPYQCAHGRPSLLALTELPEALDWKRGRKDGIDWRM
jgi:DNA mismatch repair protein MLH3